MKQYVAHHIPALQNQVDQLHHKQVRPARRHARGPAGRTRAPETACILRAGQSRPPPPPPPCGPETRSLTAPPGAQDLGLQAQRELKAQVTQVNLGVQELEGRINEMHATMEATQEQANQGIKLLCRSARPHLGLTLLPAAWVAVCWGGHGPGPTPRGLCRVIGDLMRGNPPSKTSTLQDLDKYVNQPQFRGIRPPGEGRDAVRCPCRACPGAELGAARRAWRRCWRTCRRRSRRTPTGGAWGWTGRPARGSETLCGVLAGC